MMKFLKNIFAIEKNPRKGLIPMEWVVLGYIAFTFILFIVLRTDIPNPDAIISLRIQAIAMTAGLWLVYRCIPCKFIFMLRCCLQMALLGSWYPDIYEFNRVFPNLDHVFAQLEQTVFGCQPALLFYENFSHPIFSELLDMGYVSYYVIMFVVMFYYFFKDYANFEKSAFVFFTSFFMSYVIFLFLSVSGPQFYYQAVGIDKIANGVFPDLGHYFMDHQESLPLEGWAPGIFYKLHVCAFDAGERPIAAFPSSHVSVTLSMVILAFKGNRKLGWSLLVLFVLLCLSTVYVKAHYAIDVIGGLIWGTIVYFACCFMWKTFNRK